MLITAEGFCIGDIYRLVDPDDSLGRRCCLWFSSPAVPSHFCCADADRDMISCTSIPGTCISSFEGKRASTLNLTPLPRQIDQRFRLLVLFLCHHI